MNWYHYGFRMYDAALGRFPSMDPISDKFPHVSTYNYAENEPVGSIDLWGLQRWMVNGRERTEAYSKSTKKQKQIGFALVHRREAYAIGNLGSENANNITMSATRISKALYGGKETSSRNSFRHALWSSTITANFGEKIAERATNAHEGVSVSGKSRVVVGSFNGKGKEKSGLADTIVDLLNNDIGREIGAESSDSNPLNLAKSVLEISKTDGLWVAKTDDKGNISIVRERISEKQYQSALKSLENLDENGREK